MNKIRAWLRATAWWVLGNVAPLEDETDAALRKAFTTCGLPEQEYSQDFNLRHSGKLHEVLVHASDALGNPLMTVADVKRLLR